MFLYSGQGPRWPGTGKDLFEQDERFREEICECDALLCQMADWRLTVELFREGGNSRRDDTDVAQPAHFAYQLALTKWLIRRGIAPDAVFGHSMGEVAAAHVAGILSLPEAIRVIYHRGRLTHATAGQGRMCWIDSPPESTEQLLREAALETHLSITAVNEPETSVVAGATVAVEALVGLLKERHIRHNVLGFKYGFHSPLMDPYQPEFAALLHDIRPRTATVPIVSTVTGDYLDGTAFDSSYWSRNLRETVRFADAVKRLADWGATVFVEIGPHALLTGSTEACLLHGSRRARVMHTLYRGEPDLAELSKTLYELQALCNAARQEGRSKLPS